MKCNGYCFSVKKNIYLEGLSWKLLHLQSVMFQVLHSQSLCMPNAYNSFLQSIFIKNQKSPNLCPNTACPQWRWCTHLLAAMSNTNRRRMCVEEKGQRDVSFHSHSRDSNTQLRAHYKGFKIQRGILSLAISIWVSTCAPPPPLKPF